MSGRRGFAGCRDGIDPGERGRRGRGRGHCVLRLRGEQGSR